MQKGFRQSYLIILVSSIKKKQKRNTFEILEQLLDTRGSKGFFVDEEIQIPLKAGHHRPASVSLAYQ